jgi:phosphoribosylamine--glycine ligase
MKKKILLVGGGGREHSFAQKLVEDADATIYAIMGHANPGIIDCVTASQGVYIIDDANQPDRVLSFAKQQQVDYVFVSADTPLANGVVDVLLSNNIKAIGGNQAATRIEWDKIYSIEMMQKVCPEYTPFYRVVADEKTLAQAIDEFKQKQMQIVVKPQGLTGGKGVKVMPEHLSDYQHASNYALELLSQKNDEKVLLVEKLEGLEFTIMGLTDGKNLVMCPASYDYPFRLQNDYGAGTGGMGCFTNTEHKLPFMREQDWNDCQTIMQRIIDQMRKEGLLFNGVLNGGFFLTPKGIRFMEFNGRFGDPEALNILSVLKSSFLKLIEDLWHQRLSTKSVEFLDKASVVKYLVAKEYPQSSPEALDFSIDKALLEKENIRLFYSSCIRKGEDYQTLKSSRVIALGAISDSISEASERINKAISQAIKGNLDYRQDIASKENLKKLQNFNVN